MFLYCRQAFLWEGVEKVYNCIFYISLYCVYTVHCTLYTVHCTVYSVGEGGGAGCGATLASSISSPVTCHHMPKCPAATTSRIISKPFGRDQMKGRVVGNLVEMMTQFYQLFQQYCPISKNRLQAYLHTIYRILSARENHPIPGKAKASHFLILPFE